VTRNELETFRDHVELALEYDRLILIHTPHLEDKLKGTEVILRTLASYEVDPNRVMVDHAEEHTLGLIREAGYWAGLTLYPETKVSLQRAADMIEMHGPERLCLDSACDWGHSVPLAVPRFVMEMRRRRHPDSLIRKLVLGNPVEFLGQSPRFEIPPQAREGADRAEVATGAGEGR
jgi:predicted metal-dependent TIM-barrel fold hydrolase